MSGNRDLLVFDSRPDGHRRSYVDTLAALAGGTPRIAPVRRSLASLLLAPKLLLTTFETSPRWFALVMVLRAALGRKTAAIFLRAHLHRQGGAAKRLLYRPIIWTLNRLPSVLLLTLVPVAMPGRNRFVPIADPQFWDVGPAALDAPDTDLSRRVREVAGGRAVLLFTGYVEASRGVGFLRDVFAGDGDTIRRVLPVLAGIVMPDGEGAAADLAAAGAVVEGRFVTDAEQMSLFRAASAVWCCFTPERDMSSGVFGRAVQFGAAPIVRKGSALEAMAGDVGNAVVIDYGDVAGARAHFEAGFDRLAPPVGRHDAEREALRRLLSAHFGLPAASGN